MSKEYQQRRSHHKAGPHRVALKVKAYFFRLDVQWTLLFFIFLVAISALTMFITEVQIQRALVDTVVSLHGAHRETVLKKMDIASDAAFQMGAGFFALHADSSLFADPGNTLVRLCSILDTFDRSRTFRSLAFTSLQELEAVACMHGDAALGSLSQLYGWISTNSVINGTYLVDNTTYQFMQPLEPVYGGWPTSENNLSSVLSTLVAGNVIFSTAIDYYYGRIKSVDTSLFWRAFEDLPHILYLNIPAGILFHGLNIPDSISILDYVDVRLDGSGIFMGHTTNASLTSITVMALINRSLSDSDPLVLSNNWDQDSVSDYELLTPAEGHNVTYLSVSNISNPLMRATLQHVDFKAMQIAGYNYTFNFRYHGIFATATAITYRTAGGLIQPMVFVTSQSELIPFYATLRYIFNGVSIAVIILLTVVFWFLMKWHLRDPLDRMTTLLIRSTERGRRTLYHRSQTSSVELTEVRQLANAYNATILQLREIDNFIPEGARRELQRRMRHPEMMNRSSRDPSFLASTSAISTATRPERLRNHLSTVLYLRIQPAVRPDQVQSMSAIRGGTEALPGRQRLAAIAANAARTVAQVNSGPFASPESLTAFATRVHELCEAHHGSLLRLSPDSVVIHFHHAVRAQLLLSEASAVAVASTSTTQSHHEAQARRLQERSTRDAYDAAAFALELQRWVDECAAPLPDMHMLLDTALFTCGHYRALGSDQTVPVALGRDVQREVGHVPAKIGVRIAMTEETAQRVRYKEAAALGSRGVRQIPVEAFHTGRRGLNLDAVVLFEVLPGSVAGDAAWLSFERDCSKAFGCMIQGDYVEALRSYRSVATIVDLEPGLMPRSLRREAAAASVTGGATSTQVQRLMRECLQRIRDGCTEGFHRVRHVPLGIDAQLTRSRSVTFVPALVNSNSVDVGDRNPLVRIPTKAEVRALAQLYPAPQERHVVEVVVGGAVTRRVFRPPSAWISDNVGLRWHLGSHSTPPCIDGRWFTRIMGLGDAGAVSTVSFLAFREVPPLIERLLRDAPLGVMSDQLRSAVPVAGPTPQQEAMLHTLFTKHQTLLHPNLLTPLGYSTDEEGGVVIIWEHCAGGTMRDVIHRYLKLKPLTIARFMCNVLSGLAFLHSNGLAHGAFHMHNIMVHADGECRMLGYSSDMEQAAKLFVLPATCYISPHMAAGHSPTPACDMFCYGLMCIEMHSKGMVWKWASAEAAAQHSEEELEALLKDAGQDFRDAVVTGRLVARLEVLDSLGVLSPEAKNCVSALFRCLSADPALRPTAVEMLDHIRGYAWMSMLSR